MKIGDISFARRVQATNLKLNLPFNFVEHSLYFRKGQN